MFEETQDITAILKEVKADLEKKIPTAKPETPKPMKWPIDCKVGPGLEGAISCESSVGFVNGTEGRLVYRGYDIFDLCAFCSFEEVSYLLINGDLPNEKELAEFSENLAAHRFINDGLRLMMSFPIEKMNPMSALRIGCNMMRQEFTFSDLDTHKPSPDTAISSDEDSIPDETKPTGKKHAVYEFKSDKDPEEKSTRGKQKEGLGMDATLQLIAGIGTIAAAIRRLRKNHMPIEPRPDLSHAANLIYMMIGRVPTPMEERIMNVALILHMDHGMNASTFSTMVVASTLSDMYFSVGSGIAALNGPLHGGANQEVIRVLKEVRKTDNIEAWVDNALKNKRKIPGFGHRVYKSYDPRARILGPLAEHMGKTNRRTGNLLGILQEIENHVVKRLGRSKKIFPNVDLYSGLVYGGLGIEPEMFTVMFAVARVVGWTARVLEYNANNRIFRPRAVYTGKVGRKFPEKRQK